MEPTKRCGNVEAVYQVYDKAEAGTEQSKQHGSVKTF